MVNFHLPQNVAIDTDVMAMASKRNSPHVTYVLEKYKKKKQRNRNWAGEAAPQPPWLVCSSLWLNTQHSKEERKKKKTSLEHRTATPAEAEARDQGKLKVSLAYSAFQADQECTARPCLKKEK